MKASSAKRATSKTKPASRCSADPGQRDSLPRALMQDDGPPVLLAGLFHEAQRCVILMAPLRCKRLSAASGVNGWRADAAGLAQVQAAGDSSGASPAISAAK